MPRRQEPQCPASAGSVMALRCMSTTVRTQGTVGPAASSGEWAVSGRTPLLAVLSSGRVAAGALLGGARVMGAGRWPQPALNCPEAWRVSEWGERRG